MERLLWDALLFAWDIRGKYLLHHLKRMNANGNVDRYLSGFMPFQSLSKENKSIRDVVAFFASGVSIMNLNFFDAIC